MRAAKPCAHIDCPNLKPCADHPDVAWQGSKHNERRTRSGWAQQKINRAVMLEHEGLCHVCNQHGADEIDHVIPLAEGGADTPENMRPIHASPCHKDKTAAEAARGRA